MGNFIQNSAPHNSGQPHRKIIIATATLLFTVPAVTFALQNKTPEPELNASIHTYSSSNQAAATSAEINNQPNTQNTGTSKTTLTVNGEQIPVPSNGTVNKTIESDDGTVNVQASGSGQANNSNSVSTNISVNSSSTSSGGNNSWNSTNVNVSQ